jgi:hypothetical protein
MSLLLLDRTLNSIGDVATPTTVKEHNPELALACCRRLARLSAAESRGRIVSLR